MYYILEACQLSVPRSSKQFIMAQRMINWLKDLKFLSNVLMRFMPYVFSKTSMQFGKTNTDATNNIGGWVKFNR